MRRFCLPATTNCFLGFHCFPLPSEHESLSYSGTIRNRWKCNHTRNSNLLFIIHSIPFLFLSIKKTVLSLSLCKKSKTRKSTRLWIYFGFLGPNYDFSIEGWDKNNKLSLTSIFLFLFYGTFFRSIPCSFIIQLLLARWNLWSH